MALTTQEQQGFINKIKKSDVFSKTSTSRALLQYLFEATKKGVDLKEGVIEIDFFKAPGNSDKNNARVRVTIYNLRKKLNKYYESEGIEDSFRVIIDKGQYELRFEKQNVSKKILGKQFVFRFIPYLTIAFLIGMLLFVLLPPTKTKIWRPFLTNEGSTTLYVGDVFGIYGKTITGKYGWIRDFSINNLQELYRFSNKHPELRDDIKPAVYNYTTGMAVLSTQKLQAFFQNYGNSFTIRFTTKTSISEIKEGNAIYVGPIKNDNPFIHFFNKENPYFKIAGDSLLLENHPTLNDTIFNLFYYGEGAEYAIVSKLPGPNETEQLLFFSNHDIGVTSTVEYFTKLGTIRKFQKENLQKGNYFTAIFIANGLDRTDTDLRLILALTH